MSLPERVFRRAAGARTVPRLQGRHDALRFLGRAVGGPGADGAHASRHWRRCWHLDDTRSLGVRDGGPGHVQPEPAGSQPLRVESRDASAGRHHSVTRAERVGSRSTGASRVDSPDKSLAFIGSGSAHEARTSTSDAGAETLSITRLEGSRWRGGRLWSWNQDRPGVRAWLTGRRRRSERRRRVADRAGVDTPSLPTTRDRAT